MVNMMLKRVVLATSCLALAACGGKTPPLVSSPALSVVEQDQLPAPLRHDQAGVARPYLVGPYDELTIDVFGIEGMANREVQVDGSGNISFPLVGSLEVGGRTPREIESELTSRLASSYIRDPQVSVNLTKTVSQVITVDGQVVKPGLYPVIGNMTLMQAVARAEGASEFAKLQDVVVFRNSGGQRYAALYNLEAIRRGMYADPAMYAGDVVVVGESRARRMFRDVLAAAPLLTAPVIGILQN